MGYRDQDTALHAQLRALERQLADREQLLARTLQLERENSALKSELAALKSELHRLQPILPESRPPRRRKHRTEQRAAVEQLRLLVVDAEAHTRDIIVSGPVIKLGRADVCEVLLKGPGVARLHAMIELGPNPRPLVTDIGSTTGTFVNNERVVSTLIKTGDVVRIADYRIVVRFN